MLNQSTQATWWQVCIPLHIAGSSGKRVIGRVQATSAEITQAFGHCARIDANNVVEIYKRP